MIKYLGAAYLVYLGIRAILERSPDGISMESFALSPCKAFRRAVLAEVLNPKSALLFLALLPQFVNPANGAPALQLTVLDLLFVVMGLRLTFQER